MLLLHHHDTRIHFLALQALAFVEWKISIPDIQSANLAWRASWGGENRRRWTLTLSLQNLSLILFCFFFRN
jgi:hypothetical protein